MKRSVGGILVVALLFLIILPHSASGAEWIRVKSPHFDVYTSQSRENATLAIERLENIHTAFLELSGDSDESREPLLVILFSGFNEFGFYNLSHFVKAYFTTVGAGDFPRACMVISDFDDKSNYILIHEFAHYRDRESGDRLPMWLSEGLASFYESMELSENQVILGKPVERHLKLLKSKHFRPLPFGDLFAMAHQERRRHTWDDSAALYAEGWAIVHFLATDPRYAASFPKFVREMRGASEAHEALAKIYNLSIAQLRGLVDEHVHEFKPRETRITHSAPAASAVEQLPLEPWESRLLLTHLLLDTGKRVEADRDLDALRREFPTVPEIYEALGSLKFRNNERAMALRHYKKAIELGSKNPTPYLRVAEVEGKQAGDTEKAFQLLDAALRVHPDDVNLRLQAMEWAFNYKDYERAAQWAGNADSAVDDPGYEFDYAAAYAHFRNDAFPEARKWLERAQSRAALASDRDRAESLMQKVDLALSRRRVAAQVAESVAPGMAFTEPGGAGPSATGANEARPTAKAESVDVPIQQVDLAKNWDRSNDATVDAERIDQTLTVFTRDRGGKVAQGVLKELRCLGSGALLVIDAAGKTMAFEIDDPSNILITRGGEHVTNHDFRCGRQPAERINIGYQPADNGKRVGFLRIMQFE